MNNNLVRHGAAKDKTPISCIKESKTVPDHPHQAPTLTDIAIFDQKSKTHIYPCPFRIDLVYMARFFQIQMCDHLLS
jgi:hypothetical protein